MSKPPHPLSAGSRNHLMSFAFPEERKESIDAWINASALFFKNTLYEVDPSTANEQLLDSLRDRIKLIEEKNRTTQEIFNLQETIEPLSVNVLVQLITMLGITLLIRSFFYYCEGWKCVIDCSIIRDHNNHKA